VRSGAEYEVLVEKSRKVAENEDEGSRERGRKGDQQKDTK
jgi:hypothetical protein